MKNIVVVSHEANVDRVALCSKINAFTGNCFTTSEDAGNNKYINYGTSTPTNDALTEKQISQGKTPITSVLFCVGNGLGWQLTVSNKTVELKVVSLSYDKRIFKPGELHIAMSCVCTDNTKPNRKALVEVLKTEFYNSADNSYTLVDFLGYSGTNSDTDVGLLGHTCKDYYVHDFSVDSNGDGTTVTLHCYSLDNLLTLDKYSKVYCGESFMEALFYKMKYKPSKLELAYGDFNHCMFKDDDSLTAVRFPFLVQYNESFYDFLTRIAVRCGEYLYYEDGTLKIGTDKTNTVVNESTVKVVYPNVRLMHSAGVDVGLLPGSCLKSEAGNSTSSPNYNMEYTSDDFLKVLADDDNDKIYNALFAWEKYFYGSAGFALSKGESIDDALTKFLTGFTSPVFDSLINRKVLKDDFKKVVKDYCDSVGINSSKVLVNKDYYTIEQDENNAQDNLVKIEYSSAIPSLRLGAIVTLSDVKYAVCHVYGSITSTDKGQNREIFAEVAPGNSTGMFIPPHYNVQRIRKAEPQEAVVKDVNDPLLLGRVRVKFLWQAKDEDEEEKVQVYEKGKDVEKKRKNYSPWLRVTVPYVGGKGGGMNMMPEPGDHVMVDYVGGNVDFPYVSGFLFTRSTMPAPGAGIIKNKLGPSFHRKVIASSKGHSITFSDIADKSSILNMVCPPVAAVLNVYQGISKQFCGQTGSRPWDENFAPFSGGITLRDSNGIYELDLSAKTRSINVNSPFGTVNISAFTGITIDAPNGDVKIRGKNVSIEAGNNVTITSGKNIKDHDYADGEWKKLAGASALKTVYGLAGKTLTSGLPWMAEMVKLTDFAFLRSSWEVIMRPVEGSLRLGSKRNMMITTGKGNVTVPQQAVSDSLIKNSSGKKLKYSETRSNLYMLNVLVGKLIDHHNGSYDNYIRLLNDIRVALISLAYTFQNAFNNMSDDSKELFDLDGVNVTLDDIKRVMCRKLDNANDMPRRSQITFLDGQIIQQLDDAQQNQQASMVFYTNFLDKYRQLQKQFKKLKMFKRQYTYDMDKIVADNRSTLELKDASFCHDLWNDNNMFGVDYTSNNFQLLRGNNEIAIDANARKLTRRRMLYNFFKSKPVEKYVKSPNNINDDANIADNVWTTWVSSLELPTPKEPNKLWALVDTTFLGLTNFAQTGWSKDFMKYNKLMKTFNINGLSGPYSMWGTASRGELLISNGNENTLRLNNRSTGWGPHPNNDPSMASLKYTLKRQYPQQPQQQ